MKMPGHVPLLGADERTATGSPAASSGTMLLRSVVASGIGPRRIMCEGRASRAVTAVVRPPGPVLARLGCRRELIGIRRLRRR